MLRHFRRGDIVRVAVHLTRLDKYRCCGVRLTAWSDFAGQTCVRQ